MNHETHAFQIPTIDGSQEFEASLNHRRFEDSFILLESTAPNTCSHLVHIDYLLQCLGGRSGALNPKLGL